MAITATFRKHSRILILVFMSVLMVVFVIGDALGSSCAGPDQAFDEVIGTAYGKPVTLLDLRRTDVDLKTAGVVGLSLASFPVADRPLNEGDRLLGWHLLRLEAERLGIGVTDDQIRQALADQGLTDAQVNQLRQGRSIDGFYNGIRAAISIVTLAQMQQLSAMGATLPQLQSAFEENSGEALVSLSVIDAAALKGQVASPTADEVQALFEAGQDRGTAHTDEALLYGYQRPERFQVEYLTIDPDVIVDRVRIKERDARAYFDANQQKYWRPSSEGAEGDAGPLLPVTYDEVRDEVRADFRKLQAVQEAQIQIAQIRDHAARPWSAGAPAEGAVIDLAGAAEAVGVTLPFELATTDLVTLAELRSVDGIGSARAPMEGRQVAFARLATNVEGAGSAGADPGLPLLKVGEPGLIVNELRAGEGGRLEPYKAYAWRVVAYEPPGPPDSIELVYDAVSADALELKAFERAGELAAQLGDAARESGLAAAVAGAGELRALLTTAEQAAADGDASGGARNYLEKLTPFEPPRFREQPSVVPNVSVYPPLHEQVFAAIAAGASAAEPAVLVIPQPRSQQWIVAEVRGVKPLYEGQFETQRRQLEVRVLQSSPVNFTREWFDYDNLLARTQFVDQRPERSDDERVADASAGGPVPTP